MANRIAILGSGDQARVVYDALDKSGRTSEVLCFVNQVNEAEGVITGWQGVRTYLSWATFIGELKDSPCSFVVALGDLNRRKKIFESALSVGLLPVSVVHPSAIVSLGSVIGAGSMISANCVIGVDATIGANCIVNSGAIVDHDCQIGSHSNIGPAVKLAGRVSVEEMVNLGIGACVLDELCIKSRSVVAAGAVVIKDVPASVMVAGVPAMIKKTLHADA